MRPGRPAPPLALVRALLLAALLSLACAPALAGAPLPPKAAIASSHPLATQAGLDMLARGGNAFDAAIAVSAVLAVVEPASSGVGGGGFYLLHLGADGHDVMVDARETAPAAATRDMYLGPNGRPRPGASTEGPLAAGIPGEPAAWQWLARKYGHLPLAVSLAPAIRAAREGFPLYARLANAIHVKQAQLARSADTASVFLLKGQPPPVGALIRQPDLARTIALIAGSGSNAFYRGKFAAQLVAHVRHDGGIWSEADLAGYRIVERMPITTHYRNATLVMAAPPSSGGVVIGEALNILAGYDLGGLDATTRRHLTIEALRHAYRDRAEYLGDPDFVKMPLEQLLSPDYAAGQRNSIRLDRATPSETLRPAFTGEESQSTTHFSVLDREGNRVAATVSVNLFFGATYMAPGTGMILNDTMDDFAVAAGVPNAFQLVGADANAIAPGKRPLSSMTPTFVDTDRGMLIIGSPGGATIISNLTFSVLNWLDGKSAAEIVSAPRIHHQYVPDIVLLEPGALTAEERTQLEKLGHHLREARNQWGNSQAITWEYGSGKVEAASDPRGYGAGLVY
ncbi:MAG TPA: gamma-glutamyltransferase [Steroidobacteraceae bacterium]|nr:gamma-glutamyltransferase [Steroidobacteraceae bacterium]